MKKDIHNYDDIINMPRHISSKHPQMKIIDRAAQFAPFAALTGHKESINEASRITDSKKELDENQKEILNNKLKKTKTIQEELRIQPLNSFLTPLRFQLYLKHQL